MRKASKWVQEEFTKSRFNLFFLNKRHACVRKKMWCSSLCSAHRLVGRAGWILPTSASIQAAVDLKYQLIGCVAFWESFSISFSGWLAVSCSVPASCLPTLVWNVRKWMNHRENRHMKNGSISITFASILNEPFTGVFPDITCNRQHEIQHIGHILFIPDSFKFTVPVTSVAEIVCQGHGHEYEW